MADFEGAHEGFTECVAIGRGFFPGEEKGELACLGELAIVNLKPLHGWIVGRQETQNV